MCVQKVLLGSTKGSQNGTWQHRLGGQTLALEANRLSAVDWSTVDRQQPGHGRTNHGCYLHMFLFQVKNDAVSPTEPAGPFCTAGPHTFLASAREAAPWETSQPALQWHRSVHQALRGEQLTPCNIPIALLYVLIFLGVTSLLCLSSHCDQDPRDAPPPTRAETREERLERKVRH